MLKEMGKDWPWVLRKITNGIANSMTCPMVHDSLTTNSTIFSLAGRVIYNHDTVNRLKLVEVEFIAESGTLGTDGLLVELFDKTNAVSIGTISFLGTEDDTIKSIDVLSYFQSLANGSIVLECNFAKGGAIGPATINSASVILKGFK